MRVGYVLEDFDVEVPPLACGPVLVVRGVDAIPDYAVVDKGFGEALGCFFVFLCSENPDLVFIFVTLRAMSSLIFYDGFTSGNRASFLHHHALTLSISRDEAGVLRGY